MATPVRDQYQRWSAGGRLPNAELRTPTPLPRTTRTAIVPSRAALILHRDAKVSAKPGASSLPGRMKSFVAPSPNKSEGSVVDDHLHLLSPLDQDLLKILSPGAI